MSDRVIKVSPLGKTWIFDIDGTIAKHNGYKLDGRDSLLPGALEFLRSIPEDDMIIFITSRTDAEKELTLAFLRDNAIRYDNIIWNAPYGERILINDRKPSGLCTAIAISPPRDRFAKEIFEIDESL